MKFFMYFGPIYPINKIQEEEGEGEKHWYKNWHRYYDMFISTQCHGLLWKYYIVINYPSYKFKNAHKLISNYNSIC